jgi:hypothetical protein
VLDDQAIHICGDAALEDGRILLSDLVSKHIPKLAGLQGECSAVRSRDWQGHLALVPAERETTVQDLLRHTPARSARKTPDVRS